MLFLEEIKGEEVAYENSNILYFPAFQKYTQLGVLILFTHDHDSDRHYQNKGHFKNIPLLVQFKNEDRLLKR